MRIVAQTRAIQAEAESARLAAQSIGLVPTMGFFHEGHLSLMRRARAECDLVIASLFVNPTQFGPGEDLSAYPRDFERDCRLAEREGVDLMFAPPNSEVYSPDHATYIDVERIGATLCGASRPGHFRGVATVVAKLFNICKPHKAYFGLKDYQQVRVIETMVRDLNFDLDVVRCPIVREPDGLAMSSRNAYLSPEERRAATVLSRSLNNARKSFEAGERCAATLKRQIGSEIEAEPLARTDYIEAVDAQSLEPVSRIEPVGQIEGHVLLAVAVRFGRARLIDNIYLERNP